VMIGDGIGPHVVFMMWLVSYHVYTRLYDHDSDADEPDHRLLLITAAVATHC